MNKQKGSVLVILLLLAGAGLAFLGYKYILKSNSQKTITPAPYPIETIDPTVNWKTYTNDKYGFELKYPNNLNYSELGPNEPQQELEKGQQISGTVEPSLASIVFRDGATKLFRIDIFNTSLKKIAIGDYKDKYLYTNGLCDIRWGFEQIEETLTTISDLNVLKVSQKNPNYQSCYYFQIQNNKLLVFSTYPLEDGLKSEELTKNLNQILSTFQHYTDISNWKTYTSKAYKYLVKYPVDITPKNIEDDLSLEFVTFENTQDKNGFWFSIRVTQKNLEFENEVNNEKAKISHSLVKLISEKNLKIQGYKAIRLDYKPEKEDIGTANTYIFIEKDMYIFSISSRTNTIDQIFSTFKFTE